MYFSQFQLSFKKAHEAHDIWLERFWASNAHDPVYGTAQDGGLLDLGPTSNHTEKWKKKAE